MKEVNLTLPEFAFVDCSGHEENILDGRNVILHVRSASVVEILDREMCVLKDNVVTKNFSYTNRYGIKEKKVIALHYSATLDAVADVDVIKQEVLIPAAKWFCDYCTWEDENIEKGGVEW